MLSRTVYCSWNDAVKIMRSAKYRKLYSHFEIEELDEKTAKDIAYQECDFHSHSVVQKYPTVKDFCQSKTEESFRKNPVKLTCFYEKTVDKK